MGGCLLQRLFLRSFMPALLLLVSTTSCVPPTSSGKEAAMYASTRAADSRIAQDGPSFTHDTKNGPQVMASSRIAEPFVQTTEHERLGEETRNPGGGHTGRAQVQSYRIPSGSTNHQNYPTFPAAIPGYYTYNPWPYQDWNFFFDSRAPFGQSMPAQESPVWLDNPPYAGGLRHQNFVYHVPRLVHVPTWVLVPQIGTMTRPSAVHQYPRGSHQHHPEGFYGASRSFQMPPSMGSTSSRGSSSGGPNRQMQILDASHATNNVFSEKSTSSEEPNSRSPEEPNSRSPRSTSPGKHLNQDEIRVGSSKMQGVKSHEANHHTINLLAKVTEGAGAKESFALLKTEPEEGLSDGSTLSEVYDEKKSGEAKMPAEIQKLSIQDRQVETSGPKETLNNAENSSANMKSGPKDQRASKRRSKKNKKSPNSKTEAKALLLQKEAEQFEQLNLEMKFDQGVKTKSPHEEAPNQSKPPSDKLTSSIFEKIKKMKEEDYQARDSKFSDLIQKAFHPSTCQRDHEIYPGIFKTIANFKLNHDQGRLGPFLSKINVNFDEDGKFIVDHESLKSNLLKILHEHLQLSHGEDYLSLSEMDLKTYKNLQLVWFLAPELVFGIPKYVTYQINKPEFYRRLETLRNQIYQHTIVENWALIKKHLLEEGMILLEQAEEFENDYQLTKMFPSVEDFPFANIDTKDQTNVKKYYHDNNQLSIIIGYESIIRQSIRNQIYKNNGKIPSRWKVPSLKEYYRYKGCNYLQLLDMMEVLGLRNSSNKLRLDSNTPAHEFYLKNGIQPEEPLSMTPWYESSTRHWMYSEFGMNYELQLSKKCLLINRGSIKTNRDVKTQKSQNILQLKEALDAYPGDFIRFGDWGLDMKILKLITILWNEEGNNGIKKLNWELIDSYLSVKLNEWQMLILESWFKEKIK